MNPTLPGATLRRVAADLRQLSYTPTSWAGLLAGHSQPIRQQLEPLLVEMTREGAHPRLIALLLERLAESQDALQRERDAWSFVWSGPDPLHARTADTFATVAQMIQEARRHILLATYNLGLSEPMRALYASMASRLESGDLQRVVIVFHPVQILQQLGPDPIATIRQWFNQQIWPWPAKPEAYVDQRLVSGSPSSCQQHAKVVLTDPSTRHGRVLITSANFSETAQRNNLEAGWLCRAPHRVQEVERQFRMAMEQGILVRTL